MTNIKRSLNMSRRFQHQHCEVQYGTTHYKVKLVQQ